MSKNDLNLAPFFQPDLDPFATMSADRIRTLLDSSSSTVATKANLLWALTAPGVEVHLRDVPTPWSTVWVLDSHRQRVANIHVEDGRPVAIKGVYSNAGALSVGELQRRLLG